MTHGKGGAFPEGSLPESSLFEGSDPSTPGDPSSVLETTPPILLPSLRPNPNDDLRWPLFQGCAPFDPPTLRPFNFSPRPPDPSREPPGGQTFRLAFPLPLGLLASPSRFPFPISRFGVPVSDWPPRTAHPPVLCGSLFEGSVSAAAIHFLRGGCRPVLQKCEGLVVRSSASPPPIFVGQPPLEV
jgi:hypothetical protein